MDETTAASPLDARLVEAQHLLDRGRPRRALDRLWEAEALARGNPEALRRMLDFVAAAGFSDPIEVGDALRRPLSRHPAGVAELVATLEQDARQASRATTSAYAVPAEAGPGWPGGVKGVLLGTFFLAFVGAAVGAIIGLAVEASCNPAQDLICIGPAASAALGATFLGIIGAGLGLVGSLLWLLASLVVRKAAR